MKKFLSKLTFSSSHSSIIPVESSQTSSTGTMGNGMQVTEVAQTRDLTKIPDHLLTTAEKTQKLAQLDALIKN